MPRSLITTLAAVLFAALATPAYTAPAQAAQTSTSAAPVITYHACGYAGGGGLICEVQFSSASPVQIRWVQNGTALPWWDDQQFITTGCQPGYTQSVRVTVSSPYGSASSMRGSYCGPGDADG